MKKHIVILLGLFLMVAAPAHADKISIGPADFMDPGDASDALGIGGWCEYVYKDTEMGNLYAQVHLPDGCVIMNIRLVYFDTDADDDVDCHLIRRNKFSGATQPLFSTASSGFLAGSRSSVDSSCVPASNRLVNNGACTYFINLYFSDWGTDLRVYSVTIEYQ